MNNPFGQDEDISIIARLLKDMLVSGAPNIKRASTGALRKSIHVESDDVIIGAGIVDNAPYTNYKWTSPRWKGAQNPNEGWMERLAIQALNIWAAQNGYKVVIS